MSKITIATVKAFLRKNPHALLKVNSDFDGMTDCVQINNNSKWLGLKSASFETKHNMGYCGIWFVGNGRDYVTPYVNNDMNGYEVTNCCGSWIIAKQI